MQEGIEYKEVDGDEKVNLDTDGPAMKLSSKDNFFLAVCKKDAKKMSFVYSVYCAATKNGNHCGFADIELATFANSQKAGIYYQTICESIKLNKENFAEAYQTFVKLNKDLIERVKRKYK